MTDEHSSENVAEDEWPSECRRWYGRELTGRWAHYCAEWDDMPLDETCEEFLACRCYGQDTDVSAITFVAGEL